MKKKCSSWIVGLLSLVFLVMIASPMPTYASTNETDIERTADSTYFFETIAPGESFTVTYEDALSFQANVDFVIYDYMTEAPVTFTPEKFDIQFTSGTAVVPPLMLTYPNAIAAGYPVETSLSIFPNYSMKALDASGPISKKGEVTIKNNSENTVGFEGFLYGIR
ncbi:hypothetical protein [Marininema halotolerans]|uniref:Uncharacterized protein n=1 Tax=Marininema halotolerans TaxID=1155944 RepID=A0A1I6U045_9BACL|nr:hypothetical protein [Marininema halotolerans]SFS94812.1 hypothetical protein SAMN05444972_11267 [Marininema halotolerans]